MARLWQSGWENNSATLEWDVRTGTNATVQGTTFNGGAFAGQVTSLVSATAAGWLQQFVSAASNGPYYFRVYFYASALPSAENSVIELVNGTSLTSAAGAMITIGSDGKFRLYRDQLAAAVGSASAAITTNTWHYVELKYDRSPAGGSQVLEARLDGTVFATASNLTITNQITSLAVGGNLDGEAQTTGTFIFDDVAINDSTGSFQNSYPGAGKIVHMHPTGVGDNTGFGLFAGTPNWSVVAEVIPDGNTSAVQSKVTNTTDDYAMTADSNIGASDTINVLAVGVYWEGTGASANSTFATRLKATSGGTVTQGSTIAPTAAGYLLNAAAAPKNYSLVSYQKPGTSTAWTKTDLGTCQIGLIIVAGSTNNARISTEWLSVDYTPNTVTAAQASILTASPGRTWLNQFAKNLRHPYPAVTVVVGNTVYTQSLTGVLSYTGTYGPTSTGKALTANLSFSGALSRAIARALSATVSFVGSVTKAISRGLTAAVSFAGSLVGSHLRLLSLTGALSFIGSQTKSTAHNSTAAVSFAGSNTKQTARSQSASLSFSGNLNRATARALAATISFVGSVTKAIAYPLTAAVSFTGSFTKRTGKTLAAAVSFTGSIARSTVALLSAAVSFSGSITRAITYPLSGALSFSGTLAKRTARAYTATISFSGSIAKAVAHSLVAAAVSFSGTVTKSTGKAVSASLSFSGSIAKLTAHSLGAALSFIGNLVASPSHGGTQFTQSLVAALSFTGSQIKQTAKTQAANLSFSGGLSKVTARALTASLNFTGSISRVVRHTLSATISFSGAIARNMPMHLAAALSFTGNIAKRIPRSFTGSLTLSGSFSKSTSKLLAASLSFTTAMRRAIAKGLTAAVTFTGTLVTSGKTAATFVMHVLLRSGNAVVKLWNKNQHVTLEDANKDVKIE